MLWFILFCLFLMSFKWIFRGVKFVTPQAMKDRIFFAVGDFLNIQIFGYSLHRWLLTWVALVVVLLHAIFSPYVTRVVTNTRVTSENRVGDAKEFSLPKVLNVFRWQPEYDRNTLTRAARAANRDVQIVLDGLRNDPTTQQPWSKLSFPLPRISPTLDNRSKRSENKLVCIGQTVNCTLKLTSDLYFAHVFQSDKAVFGLTIRKPVLVIKTSVTSDKKTSINISLSEIDTHITGKKEDGELKFDLLNDLQVDGLSATFGEVQLAKRYASADFEVARRLTPGTLPKTVQAGVVIDLTTEDSRMRQFCRYMTPNEAEKELSRIEFLRANDCFLEPESGQFTEQPPCRFGGNACALTPKLEEMDPAFLAQLQPSSIKREIDIPFDGPANLALYEMFRNRKLGLTPSNAIDFPERKAMVTQIIDDYIVIFGKPTRQTRLHDLIRASSDVRSERTDFFIAGLYAEADLATRRDAILRQPQLWPWHDLSHYVRDVVYDQLADDLVEFGLVAPPN